MAKFSYKARDQMGTLVSGEIEAESAGELKQALFDEGMVPLEVREVQGSEALFQSLSNLFGRVKQEEMLMFTRQFYTLFRAGVSMDTILATLGRHPRVFSELYVSMLAAGEEAGILEKVLKNLSDVLEKDYEIRKSVKAALLYPKIVITTLVFAVIFVMIYVVPQFVRFYSRYGAELPLPTRILIGTSAFFHDYWYIAISLTGLGIYLFQRFYRSAVGRLWIDQFRFKLPVFGDLTRKVANARFAHIMSSLYGAGVSMPRSLEVVADTIGNRAFAKGILAAKEDIQKGASLAKALGQQPYFFPVTVEATAVGERAGALGDMLSSIAEHYDLEVSHTVKGLTTLLEPILLVIIFSMVALLALAIYLPIWNLSQVVL